LILTTEIATEMEIKAP